MLPVPYSDLTNLPGDTGQFDFSSAWMGAVSAQFTGLPQGAHQIGSSFVVEFTFPNTDDWYQLANVQVVAINEVGAGSQVESFAWTVSGRARPIFTQKPTAESEPFNDASGNVFVERGAMASAQWSQISFTVLDSAGDPIVLAAGVITGASKVSGQGNFTPFAATLDLAADDWVFLPNQAAVEEFRFSVAGLTAGYTVVATVTSWL